MPVKRKTTKKKVKRTRKKTRELDIKQIKPVKAEKKEILAIEPAEEPIEYVFDLPQSEVKIQEAPLLRRVAAFVIDSLLIYFVFFQIFMFIYLPAIGFPSTAGMDEIQGYFVSNPPMMGKVAVGIFALLVISLFYFMLTEKIFGKSLGKRMMGLQVTFKRRSYWNVFLRNLTKTVLLPFLFIDLVGIVLTKDRQRFTEVPAGSKVIYEPKLNLIYEW